MNESTNLSENAPLPNVPLAMVSLDIGSVVDGRYEVVAFVGRGGSATVYRARHIFLNRTVALKILDPRSTQNAQMRVQERFLSEAQTISQLKHPCVPLIHDFGVIGENGLLYTAMSFFEGHDLDHELNVNGPLAPSRALQLLSGALEAIGMGHDLGVVHRDLKPSNLFMEHPETSDERLVVLDFGIALSAWTGRVTNMGEIVGTPSYLPPEYIREGKVTPAMDVYQIGLILVEMLCGLPVVPFEDPYQCMMAHVEARLNVPEILLDSPLGPIINGALSRNVDDRFSDAEDLRRALADVVDEFPPEMDAEWMALFRSPGLVRSPKVPPRSTPAMPAAAALLEGLLGTEGSTSEENPELKRSTAPALDVSDAAAALEAIAAGFEMGFHSAADSRVEATHEPSADPVSAPPPMPPAAAEADTTAAAVADPSEAVTTDAPTQPSISSPERTSSPELKRTSSPELKRTSSPELKRTSPPELKRTSSPELKRTSSPEFNRIRSSTSGLLPLPNGARSEDAIQALLSDVKSNPNKDVGRRSGWLVLLIALLVLLLVGALFWVMSGEETEPRSGAVTPVEAKPTEGNEVSALADVAAPLPTVAEDPPVARPRFLTAIWPYLQARRPLVAAHANLETAATRFASWMDAMMPVEIELVTVPEGAMIEALDGTVLGNAPRPIRFENASSEPVALVLQLRGYMPHSLTVSPETSSPLSVSLTPVPRGKPRRNPERGQGSESGAGGEDSSSGGQDSSSGGQDSTEKKDPEEMKLMP